MSNQFEVETSLDKEELQALLEKAEVSRFVTAHFDDVMTDVVCALDDKSPMTRQIMKHCNGGKLRSLVKEALADSVKPYIKVRQLS